MAATFRSSTSATFQSTAPNLAPPAGVVAGDALKVECFNDAAITADPNWTSVSGSPSQDPNTGRYQWLATRKATGTASDNCSPTFSGGGTSCALAVTAFQGANATPFSGVSNVQNANANPELAPANTPVGNDACIFAAFSDSAGPATPSGTPPTGFTISYTAVSAGIATFVGYHKALTGQAGVAQAAASLGWSAGSYGIGFSGVVESSGAPPPSTQDDTVTFI